MITFCGYIHDYVKKINRFSNLLFFNLPINECHNFITKSLKKLASCEKLSNISIWCAEWVPIAKMRT